MSATIENTDGVRFIPEGTPRFNRNRASQDNASLHSVGFFLEGKCLQEADQQGSLEGQEQLGGHFQSGGPVLKLDDKAVESAG